MDPREVAAMILAEAARAGLSRDDRLPTERELAELLDVSRTTVRNALGLLAAEGRISREVGRGTFLRGPVDGARSADGGSGAGGAVNDVGPADVMVVRCLLEPQAMPLVVARATARDFAEMDRCLAGGDAAETFDEFEAWDMALHRSVIDACHNALLSALYTTVESARQGALWGDLKRRRDSRDRRDLYCRQHRTIVEALRARDSDGALDAMRTHLTTVQANLLGQV